MSPNATTLNATGNVLFDRQCGGNTVHTNSGLPVRINSPGCSDRKSPNVRSARMSDVILVYASLSRLAAVGGDVFSVVDVPPPLFAEVLFVLELFTAVPALALPLFAVFKLLFAFVLLPVKCILFVAVMVLRRILTKYLCKVKLSARVYCFTHLTRPNGAEESKKLELIWILWGVSQKLFTPFESNFCLLHQKEFHLKNKRKWFFGIDHICVELFSKQIANNGTAKTTIFIKTHIGMEENIRRDHFCGWTVPLKPMNRSPIQSADGRCFELEKL